MSKQPIRNRVCALLLGEGILIEPADIWFAQGGDRRRDGARWGALYARQLIPLRGAALTLPCGLHSWSTLTDCARHGVDIAIDGLEIEVFALSPKRR